MRALPEPFRSDAEAAATAVVVEPAGWDRPARTVPIPEHLEAVQRAVIEGRQISLDYVARDRARTTRLVHPLGLAAKGSVWYLVAATDAGLRTFRVDRMVSVAPTGQPVVRPDGFDLAAAWRLISTEVEERRAPLRATALATPRGVERCRWAFGTRVRIGPPAGDGRIEMAIRGHSVDSLAGELAGFGAELEIVDPPQVRERLARIGAELAVRYGQLRDRVPPAH